MPNIGPLELTLILVIVVVLFGAKRLPDLGKSLGKGIREFQSAISSKKSDADDAKKEEL
ncbi:twin-arginine translocase TatA/TatE family subunit [Candidatus Desantisbacteria bacterium CG_4_9_14_3_um_filter_40_11]|uniref:Sec-independent protein translocase protein TatA n=4 Tax=unclassified Candidatus Desantisiibacteriota TaxID=3106372 RepID=A0A2M7JDJ5_9BACT|nr:MAG: twin-arginine translocase TatA/TatE family subunit [Candidatus Desantisbacteria bacterium CG23_combo_of_CG06-09_8_20_14_all_40_23]PIX17469.1 MAG: twin-arginine translocase TatA/TatE family subunit [Candidatus Desantisbacteria bacterium CG_4_8_14_3_um_filter_40_12]PIY20329.1 MAG: twin-arginine translocase TatA/TatE family subunit [Candidatus Desantisbacteria bacterium CG_4_10_14_3_um_filter_40_18]PJB29705.1 MAG: twin-arginine translocase TatA/TatE family subunit [Candidatus Desantisbacter